VSYQLRSFLHLLEAVFQRLALIAIALSALALISVTLLAALGHLPWLDFSVNIGATPYDNAGRVTQIAGTVLAVMLCFFLPANRRIMRLETSHRDFHIGMNDVAHAYAAAHAADREGLFQLSSEFDSVRERLSYLRGHPDLGSLEPEILELAAQMSHISRELADFYGDEKVARARAFLTQRQQEVEAFNARLDQAKHTCRELRQWAHMVDLEESVAISQLNRLRDDMRDLLPELGQEDMVDADGNVITMSNKTAAE